MSLSDREPAEGFAGGNNSGVATLDRTFTRDVLPSEGFTACLAPAVLKWTL
jgi:hypothetical protein